MDAPNDSPQAEPRHTCEASATRRRHALIVENDAAIRNLTAAVLRRQGFEVDLACNGRDALDVLAKNDGYDVILLDLAMPDMGGAALLDELRERMPAQLRRVVIVTAAVHEVRRGLPTDICRVVEKPFNIADLIAAVESCAA